MNYQDLQNEIADWLDRSDLTGVIPSFIRNAEYMINRELRIAQMEQVVTLSVVDGAVDLPTDFAEMRNIYSDTTKLVMLTPEQFAQEYLPLTEGQPGSYSIIGTTLQFGQVSDSDITLHYFAKFAPLSNTNISNWLTDNASDLLLYGSLLQAKGYLIEPQRMAEWFDAYNVIKGQMNTESVKSRFSGGRLRSTGPYAA